MGLQIPRSLGDEVSLSDIGRRCWFALPGIASRDSEKQGDDHLCRLNKPRSCAHADWNSAQSVSIKGGPVSQREGFAQIAVGVFVVEEAILGPAFVGKRLLGGFKRERDRRSLEGVHQESEAE